MGSSGNIPLPGRMQMLEWLGISWREFLIVIVHSLFKKCGLTDERDTVEPLNMSTCIFTGRIKIDAVPKFVVLLELMHPTATDI